MAYRWFLLYLVYFIAALTSFAMFKAPPVFPELIAHVGFTEATVGWTTSMFAIIGIVLAFPAGTVVNQMGFKYSLILTLATILVGSALGMFATAVPLMLISRVFEGAGMGLISVVGPAAISQIMPPRKQGFAQGLYATWFPFGTVIGLNLSPYLAGMYGWTAAWKVSLVASIVLAVVVYFMFNIPPQVHDEADKPVALPTSRSLRNTPLTATQKTKWAPIVLGSVTLFLWNISYCGAIASFFPTFLQEVHGYDPQAAGFLSGLTPLLVLACGPLAGFISDKFNTQKGLMVFANALSIVLLYCAFSSNMTLVWIYILVFPLAAGAMPAGLYAIVPKTTQDPKAISLSMSIIAVFMNLGIVLGSVMFGPLQLFLGWQDAALFGLVPIAVLATITALAIKPVKTPAPNPAAVQ